MQRIDIFVKKGYDFNLSSGMTGDKWNMPMYNKNIRLFKGIQCCFRWQRFICKKSQSTKNTTALWWNEIQFAR